MVAGYHDQEKACYVVDAWWITHLKKLRFANTFSNCISMALIVCVVSGSWGLKMNESCACLIIYLNHTYILFVLFSNVIQVLDPLFTQCFATIGQVKSWNIL